MIGSCQGVCTPPGDCLHISENNLWQQPRYPVLKETEVRKEVRLLVELDQMKFDVTACEKPLIEVGDSL